MVGAWCEHARKDKKSEKRMSWSNDIQWDKIRTMERQAEGIIVKTAFLGLVGTEFVVGMCIWANYLIAHHSWIGLGAAAWFLTIGSGVGIFLGAMIEDLNPRNLADENDDKLSLEQEAQKLLEEFEGKKEPSLPEAK